MSALINKKGLAPSPAQRRNVSKVPARISGPVVARPFSSITGRPETRGVMPIASIPVAKQMDMTVRCDG